VIGDHWLDATDERGNKRLDNTLDDVRLEIEAGRQHNLPIFPVLVGENPMPRENQLPESIQFLSTRNALAIRPDPDFGNDMNILIQHLEAAMAQSG